MDIIDILLARALTPQGQIETYAEMAQKAVTKAATAASDAKDAVDDAEDALATAEAAVEAAQGIVSDVDTEIKKLILSMTTRSITDGTAYDLVTTYPDNDTATLQNIVKLYDTLGQNTDGAMTQKAITDAINSIPSGGGSTNLGPQNAGKIVIIDTDGNIISGSLTQAEIEEALIDGGYGEKNTAGLELDYDNRKYSRLNKAAGLSAGADFNQFVYYHGRIRCNVADNGTINAFYGQSGYTEDGSNGQVMVYQPKFYYKREILSGDIIDYDPDTYSVKKEKLLLSHKSLPGFKIHPLFLDDSGNELDYVLLPAFEGCLQIDNTYVLNDNPQINNYDEDNTEIKLSSIAGAKPVSGVHKTLTIDYAKKFAAHRGEGWSIPTIEMLSAMQMLFIVEYGTPNGQTALGRGVVDITTISGTNCSSITGSTSSYGQSSGAAASTVNEKNGSYTTQTTNGKVAISYRGYENPWGNIWQMYNGLITRTDYTGTSYYLDTGDVTLTPVNINLPNDSGWINNFGYIADYDYLYIPRYVGGTSALPVGDYIWRSSSTADMDYVCMFGGTWTHGDNCGIFNYSFDKNELSTSGAYSARIMYKPTIGTIYNQNIVKWAQAYGGV